MSHLVRDATNNVAQFLMPNPDEILYVTISGTSAQSSAVSADKTGNAKRLCIITSTTACWFAWGTNPTAAAGSSQSIYLPAGAYFYLELNSGDKVAFIQASAGGTGVVAPTR